MEGTASLTIEGEIYPVPDDSDNFTDRKESYEEYIIPIITLIITKGRVKVP